MNRFGQGKSEHKFTYTYSDIARLTKLTKNTIKLYVYQKKFDPNDLLSVIQFIVKYIKNQKLD